MKKFFINFLLIVSFSSFAQVTAEQNFDEIYEFKVFELVKSEKKWLELILAGESDQDAEQATIWNLEEVIVDDKEIIFDETVLLDIFPIEVMILDKPFKKCTFRLEIFPDRGVNVPKSHFLNLEVIAYSSDKNISLSIARACAKKVAKILAQTPIYLKGYKAK